MATARRPPHVKVVRLTLRNNELVVRPKRVRVRPGWGVRWEAPEGVSFELDFAEAPEVGVRELYGPGGPIQIVTKAFDGDKYRGRRLKTIRYDVRVGRRLLDPDVVIDPNAPR